MVVASVLLAAALNFIIPKRKPVMAEKETTLVEQFAEGVQDVLPQALEVVAEAAHQVQVWAGILPPESPGYDHNVVMLKEPVLVLSAPDEVAALHKGTQLPLVQQDGNYLRVKHAKKVLTIPRSAAVPGTYHGR